jgi:acetolactate synthase regulatory subunit
MPRTLTATAPTTAPARSADRTRLYDVDLVGDDPEALVRVLATLRRRRCRITSVSFTEGDRHRPHQLVLGIEAPPAHAHVVTSWIERLVDVAAVHRLR